jgi:hypothetical protein
MRRLSLALGLGLVTACLGTALADPVFDFTVIGDGHTFQFSLPNPATINDHPHALNINYGSVAGTVDGVGGYTFTPAFIAESNGYAGADFSFDVTPIPTGPPPPLGDSSYNLFGPTLFTLVSDVPNPNGNYDAYDGDFLTFAFVPGDYTFSGLGSAPNTTLTYSVDITQEAAAVTPEPGTWILWLTAAGLLAVTLRRKSVAPAPGLELEALMDTHC